MELLTVQETAQLLKVSPITVRRHIKSGRLAGCGSGGRCGSGARRSRGC